MKINTFIKELKLVSLLITTVRWLNLSWAHVLQSAWLCAWWVPERKGEVNPLEGPGAKESPNTPWCTICTERNGEGRGWGVRKERGRNIHQAGLSLISAQTCDDGVTAPCPSSSLPQSLYLSLYLVYQSTLFSPSLSFTLYPPRWKLLFTRDSWSLCLQIVAVCVCVCMRLCVHVCRPHWSPENPHQCV